MVRGCLVLFLRTCFWCNFRCLNTFQAGRCPRRLKVLQMMGKHEFRVQFYTLITLECIGKVHPTHFWNGGSNTGLLSLIEPLIFVNNLLTAELNHNDPRFSNHLLPDPGQDLWQALHGNPFGGSLHLKFWFHIGWVPWAIDSSFVFGINFHPKLHRFKITVSSVKCFLAWPCNSFLHCWLRCKYFIGFHERLKCRCFTCWERCSLRSFDGIVMTILQQIFGGAERLRFNCFTFEC